MSPAKQEMPGSADDRKRFRRGLVVGKFSPLHRGHQLVIERALAECDEVAIISYSLPEFPRCEAAARERWLAELFSQTRRLVIDAARLEVICAERGLTPRDIPHNDAGDEPHRRFCAWLCHDILHFHPDAVFTSEGYGEGFAAVLGTCLTAATSTSRQVHHVSVDPQRSAVSVSGTMLRANPHAHRKFIPPAVYADFVERICLLGAEASGKTTLAEALALSYGTAWVPEYGRERWIEMDGKLHFSDMLQIGQRQVSLELRIARDASRWLFCDTSPLTTAFYSEAMYGQVDEQLLRLANRAYDRIWLCAPDFDFVQDGTRRDAAFRDRQHAWYLAELHRRGLPYEVLAGSLGQRMARVAALLETTE